MAELKKSRLPVALALFAGWAAFSAWCVSGVPPAVDLAGHGAQMQTLAALLRGDALVSQFYRYHFALGYGLETWAFVPVALQWNGAVAAKVALFCALQLFLLGFWVLARKLNKPPWLLLLAMPLAFNMSYWYGLLPGVFSQALFLFCIWAYVRACERPTVLRLLVLNLLAVVTLLTHLMAFVLAPLVMLALALAGRPRWPAVRTLVIGMGLPALVSVPTLWTMLGRAVAKGPWAETQYALESHFNWFFKHYRPEGLLAAAGPLIVTAALLLVALLRRSQVRLPYLFAFLALVAVYLATPKTLSGIYLAAQRIPVLAGLVALLMVEARAIPKWLRAGLVAISVASLAETAVFHWRFARQVDGLTEIIARADQPGVHGYVSLEGQRVLNSVPVYLEHLGEWWTATKGGVGHNFFAQYDHHPVRQVPGHELPLVLEDTTPEARARFEQVLVFGEGTPPAPYDGWKQVDAQGKWRRLVRP